MLSQMQLNIQYEDAMELPSGEVVNFFEKLSFIRIVEVINDTPVLLFQGTLMKNRTIKEVNLIPAMEVRDVLYSCLLYTSPSPRDRQKSRMPSSA